MQPWAKGDSLQFNCTYVYSRAVKRQLHRISHKSVHNVKRELFDIMREIIHDITKHLQY